LEEFSVFYTFEKLNLKIAKGLSHLSSLRLAVLAVSAQYFTKEKTQLVKNLEPLAVNYNAKININESKVSRNGNCRGLL
jgi:hypothetical protein